MRRISIAVLLAFLSTAFLSTPVWAQFEHPDLKSGKAVVKNVVILPPNVKIVKNGVKAVEEMTEESRALEVAVSPLIVGGLNSRHCEVNDKAFSGEALEKDADLKYAVADLQKKFDEMLPQLERKPKDIRKGRFTLGDDVAKLNPGGTADALVFVRGHGQVVTGGKAFLTAMARTYTGSFAIYQIAVVDARTGAILYFGAVNTPTESITKNPERSQKWFNSFFKHFPEAAKS
jgi:hypothetical protein